MSKYLFIKKSNSFYGKAMDIVETLNCNRAISDLDSLTTNIVESCVKDTEESYQRICRHKLEESSKLTFYTSIKEDYELETYLTTLTNSNQNSLTSCEAHSSLWENILNNLESDPTNETDLDEHSLPVELMKSTDKETVIKLSKFISLCFEKRSWCFVSIHVSACISKFLN